MTNKFVSFWARFNQPEDDFIGNMVIKFDDIHSNDDIVKIEERIKRNLNVGINQHEPKVTCVSLINWKVL